MMRGDFSFRLARFSALAMMATAGASLSAQDFSVGETLHSLQNGANAISSGIDISLTSETDFFINGFNVVGGSSWDGNLAISFNGSYYDFGSQTSGFYNLGDPITGTVDWYFGGFFGGMFGLGFNDTVPLGTYTTEIEIFGGATSTSEDVLFSFEETIEVVEYGLNLSSPDTNVFLAPLGSTVIRHRLINNGSKAFLMGSRYYGWSEVGRDQFDIQFSNNYPGSIGNGEDLLVNHLDVTALASFTTPWNFQSGIIGGHYSDDATWFEVSGHTLTPVPEPATMIALGGAVLALASGRRRIR
jgi:hypothetical protein